MPNQSALPACRRFELRSSFLSDKPARSAPPPLSPFEPRSTLQPRGRRMPELPQTRKHARCTATHRVTSLSMHASSADLINAARPASASWPAQHRSLICPRGKIVLPGRTELSRRVSTRPAQYPFPGRPSVSTSTPHPSPFLIPALRRELLKRLCCMHV